MNPLKSTLDRFSLFLTLGKPFVKEQGNINLTKPDRQRFALKGVKKSDKWQEESLPIES